eukprot:TRINITY_DN19523_c0_g1_i1.p1 TRINITY_DN19523_c0_g1~~TRINITY_DN19523_c0_g1_i1.p1  ORF type:complete len:653 (+),score=198.24 TRINITY_DN19523_c0_g1_i1:128-2086(+)
MLGRPLRRKFAAAAAAAAGRLLPRQRPRPARCRQVGLARRRCSGSAQSAQEDNSRDDDDEEEDQPPAPKQPEKTLPAGVSAAALCQVLHLAGAQVPDEVVAALRTVSRGQPMSPAELAVKSVLQQCGIGDVGGAEHAQLVAEVKKAQRHNAVFCQAWHDYCGSVHDGRNSPAERTVAELKWALEHLWEGFDRRTADELYRQEQAEQRWRAAKNYCPLRRPGDSFPLPELQEWGADAAMPKWVDSSAAPPPGQGGKQSRRVSPPPPRELAQQAARVLCADGDALVVQTLDWDHRLRTVSVTPQQLTPSPPRQQQQEGAHAVPRPALLRGELRLATYNVWFGETSRGDPAPAARMAAVAAELRRVGADIVCLQEVTPALMQHLMADPWVGSSLWVSDPVGTHGVVFLSRLPLQDLEWWSFSGSEMGRGLLSGTITVAGRQVAVGCVHLESLDSRALRREQLQVSTAVLNALTAGRDSDEPCAARLLAGDFNFDDEANVLSERRAELENRTIEDLLVGWEDAATAAGKSFDTGANGMLAGRAPLRLRCDRVLLHGRDLRPGRAGLLGTEPVVVQNGSTVVRGALGMYTLLGADGGLAVECPVEYRQGAAFDEAISKSTGLQSKAPLLPPPAVYPSDHFGVYVDMRVGWLPTATYA